MFGKSDVDLVRLLSAPLQVTWVVTSRCDLKCSYCLEDAAPGYAPDGRTLVDSGNVESRASIPASFARLERALAETNRNELEKGTCLGTGIRLRRFHPRRKG